MKLFVKAILYVVLVVGAVISFGRFRHEYTQSQADAELKRSGTIEQVSTNDAPDVTAAAGTANASTNAATAAGAAMTNTVANATGGTNDTPTAAAPAEAGTNAVAAAASAPKQPAVNTASKASPGGTKPNTMLYLGLFIGAMIGLGVLGGWDISQYLAARAQRMLEGQEGIGAPDPEYDAAEAEWSRGNHLDAISMLREYLKKNPDEQHAAIRIAEIYEKDLGNPLAAALELEDVLQHKLPREKWGWTAIHLANIYSGKLNQPAKAMVVLERLAHEYADTAAGRKARQRLGIPEATPEADATLAATTADTDVVAADPEPEPDGANPHLPKGFKAKKR